MILQLFHRRINNMSTGAVVFLVFSIVVLWGGLAVCLRIAMKNKDK